MVGREHDPTFDLAGRVAIVTGGAGLLGVEHAAALLSAGATVFIADVRIDVARDAASALARSHDGRAHALSLDVGDPASVRAALAAILVLSKRVDILVNNAAIDAKVAADGLRETSRLEHFPLDAWDREVRVGLTGAFLCSQTFGSHMAANGGGVILNVASDLSVIAPDQRLYRKDGVPDERQPVKPVTYPVIKTGLIGLTRYLATYWAEQGVRVNALSPGGVQVDQPAEFVDRIVTRIPMGRMANSADYRGAVVFLCSDASRYMTGQNVVIDGGRSLW
jgi:NAD(P)-dependent dehydrogenase (short-subunit alcohol dehydrogenase family)